MDKEKMKISVVTVCKDPGEALNRTVESVLAQTYSDIEYIIVDGASTDGTIQYLKEINMMIRKGEISSLRKASMDKFFATARSFKFISEPDSGIYNAMNKGMGLSSGDFILFLNAGDYLVDKNILSKMAEKIDKNRADCDIYFGDIISENPVLRTRYQVPNRLKKINAVKLFFWTVPHAAAFIKKDSLAKVGGYDESFKIASDYDFFIKALIIEKMKFKYISLNISFFQTGGISSTPVNKGSLKSENLKIIKKYYGTFSAFIYNFTFLLVVLRFVYKVWLKLEKYS